jgi:Holliday junction DNA helicase RuvA
MIEFLSGTIQDLKPVGIVLDVNGVGYGLDLPLSFVTQLTIGATCQVWVHTRVREDTLHLYGFASKADRDLFELLIQINGVGPKVAMAILSTLTVLELVQIVDQNRVDLLTEVPGIGLRTAEKVMLELKAKLSKSAHAALLRRSPGTPAAARAGATAHHTATCEEDLKSALTNLGFKDKEIAPILQVVLEESPAGQFADLLRTSLQRLKSKTIQSLF